LINAAAAILKTVGTHKKQATDFAPMPPKRCQ